MAVHTYNILYQLPPWPNSGGTWAGAISQNQGAQSPRTCAAASTTGQMTLWYSNNISAIWTAPSSTSSGSITIGATCGRFGTVYSAEVAVHAAAPVVGFCAQYISTCGTSMGWATTGACETEATRMLTSTSQTDPCECIVSIPL
eukprot:m.1465670 g.1465670  ORF g.1465670 m.1465670 type:complete len:144 (+) comp25136_c0_seq27:742-1173(+)